jgi:nucleotide-binding universal stress UspA family protein
MAGKQIVVGFDWSAGSRAALGWAITEAGVRNCPLLIVHANTESDVAAGAERSVQAMLSGLAVTASRRQSGVPVSASVADGSPVEALIELSADAELVVLGRRGAAETTSSMLGSVSQHVAARAHCPVAVVPESAAKTPDHALDERIVVGLSANRSGLRALEFALAEADARAVSVDALHAVRPDGSADDGVTEWEGDTVADFDAEVRKIIERHPNVPVQLRPVVEAPSVALTEASEHAQLLVLGSYHSDNPWAARLGPVPTELLGTSLCPVVLVGVPVLQVH